MAYPAQGAVVDSGPGHTLRFMYGVDPANATTVQSAWINVGSDGIGGCIEVRGWITTTVSPQIMGYQGPSAPTAAVYGQIWGATLVANGFYDVDNPPQWISIQLPRNTTTANSIEVYYLGRRYSYR